MNRKILLVAACLLCTVFLNAQNDSNAVMSFDQYSFISPKDWTLQKGNGFITLRQPMNPSGLMCLMTIIAPQPSSGNTETDVKSVFNMMYPDWKFYYSDARHDDLIKGYTRQGLEFCMMEAYMWRERPGGQSWDYETGTAVIVKSGTQSAIISIRHEPTGLNCQCKQRYDNFGKFFNSFKFKNAAQQNIPLSALTGSWTTSGGRAMNEYIFAANGNYQYIFGYGTYSNPTPDILQLKTSAWQGDGSYTLKGDQLILKKRGGDIQTYRFRMEKINKGSTGWKDRIVLLNEKPIDKGPPYEVIYEKTERK